MTHFTAQERCVLWRHFIFRLCTPEAGSKYPVPAAVPMFGRLVRTIVRDACRFTRKSHVKEK